MKSVLELYRDQERQEGFKLGFQQGQYQAKQRLQLGERKRLQELITIISNGLEEGIMPSTLSSISNVSHDFVRYVESYFKANSGKTDEENVNALVEKVMSGEISTK